MCLLRIGAAVIHAATAGRGFSAELNVALRVSTENDKPMSHFSIVREMPDISSYHVFPAATQHYWLPLGMDREIHNEII